MNKSQRLLDLVEKTQHPFKDMLHKNTIGVLRTFTGPFSGLVEPLVNAGFDSNPLSKKRIRVDRKTYRAAEKMAEHGFPTIVEFESVQELRYFKNLKDAKEYAKRQKLKIKKVYTFKDLYFD